MKKLTLNWKSFQLVFPLLAVIPCLGGFALFGDADKQGTMHAETAKLYMAASGPDYPELSYDFEVAVQPDSFLTHDIVDADIMKQAKSMEDNLNLYFAGHISDGVVDFAQLIAERLAAPAQQAESTETFIRVRYTYKLDFASAPSDWEPNDLFQSIAQEDVYGDFKSTFAIMDRLEGITSTLVVDIYLGPGTEEQTGDSDAVYSWVEIEFEEDAGWIIFDTPFLPLQPGSQVHEPESYELAGR